MAQYNYDNLWKIFQRKQKITEEKARSKGMPYFKSYETKQEFIDTFRLARAEFGNTKTVSQTLNYMVDNEVYTYSEAQAKHLVERMAIRGRNISFEEARSFGGIKLEEFDKLTPEQQEMARDVREYYQEMKDYYHELRAQGEKGKDAKRLVAIEYHGSDPDKPADSKKG